MINSNDPSKNLQDKNRKIELEERVITQNILQNFIRKTPIQHKGYID